LKTLISEIYDLNPIRIVIPPSLDDGKRYDFALVLPESKSREEQRHLVEQGIQNYFHVTATPEEHLSDVYVVTAPNGTPPPTRARQIGGQMGGFRSSSVGYESTGSMDDMLNQNPKPSSLNAIRSISIRDATIDEFCHTLESNLDRPVVNETKLEGKYDFQVRPGGGQQNDFLQQLENQLNLVVTPEQRNIETLMFQLR
jgi:uncharacterized protein (TIGR03435 family)